MFKSLLLIATLALSSNAYAQSQKTLVYCDHNAIPQQNSLFMDLFFDYHVPSSSYYNAEVGFLNIDNTGYPEYLYTTNSILDPLNFSQAHISATKDQNLIEFSLNSTGKQLVGGVDQITYNITVVAGKVNSFSFLANGTVDGVVYSDAIFNCYDPSLLTESTSR